jgi:hypothetical protein
MSMTALIAAKGDEQMEQKKEKLPPAAPAKSPVAGASTESSAAEPKRDAAVAQRARRAAPAKAKGTRKATAKRKAPQAQKAPPRPGTRAAQVVALLQRKGGATLVAIMDKMGWQRHTVRGFVAGAMKKAGYTIVSFRSAKGERTYRIDKQAPAKRNHHARS